MKLELFISKLLYRSSAISPEPSQEVYFISSLKLRFLESKMVQQLIILQGERLVYQFKGCKWPLMNSTEPTKISYRGEKRKRINRTLEPLSPN